MNSFSKSRNQISSHISEPPCCPIFNCTNSQTDFVHYLRKSPTAPGHISSQTQPKTHKRSVTTAQLLSMDTHSTSSRDPTLSGTESPYVPGVPNSQVIPRFTLWSTPDITTHTHAKQGLRPWPTTAITARRSPELLTHYSSVPDPSISPMTSSSATIQNKNETTNKY